LIDVFITTTMPKSPEVILAQHPVLLRLRDGDVDGGSAVRVLGHEVADVNRPRGTGVVWIGGSGRHGNTNQHQQLTA